MMSGTARSPASLPLSTELNARFSKVHQAVSGERFGRVKHGSELKSNLEWALSRSSEGGECQNSHMVVVKVLSSFVFPHPVRPLSNVKVMTVKHPNSSLWQGVSEVCRGSGLALRPVRRRPDVTSWPGCSER